MVKIVPVTPDRHADLVELVNALADYEHLDRPSAEAVGRLCNDITGPHPRIESVIALDNNEQPVGYAIYLETYSSFRALPTMYLEDIFVREEARGEGFGEALFSHVVEAAKQRGCGRIDWQVLDWNVTAREFYERRGARCLDEWKLYRIEL